LGATTGASRWTYASLYAKSFDGLMYNPDPENADERDVDAIVKALPKNIYAACEQILNRSPNPGLTRKLLHIMLAAPRALTVKELQSALTLADDQSIRHYSRLKKLPDASFKKKVAGLCGAFIVFEQDKSYLFHQTVAEFLRSLDSFDSPSKYSLTRPNLFSWSAQSSSWQHTFNLAASSALFVRISLLSLC
jgi:hypothetical protein